MTKPADVIKVAFPTDQHVPYEDKQAVELAMKIVQKFDPDEFIVGSDNMDFYAVSKFDKNPRPAGSYRFSTRSIAFRKTRRIGSRRPRQSFTSFRSR